MKPLVVAVLTAGSLFAAPVPAVAGAVLHTQSDVCGFTSAPDPTVAGGTVESGELHGGPLLATTVEGPGWETATILLKCVVHVGAANATHTGADAAALWSPANPGVAVLTPGIVSFAVPSGEPVYVCSQAYVNGQARYWDAIGRIWSPWDGVPCSPALGVTPDDLFEEPDPEPGLPSSSCDAGQQVHDGTIAGLQVKLYVLQRSPQDVDVCFRVAGTGGKIAIMPHVPDLLQDAPGRDGSSTACTDFAPNHMPGPHPLAAGSALGTPYLVDTYWGGPLGSVWVCLRVGTLVSERVLVPFPFPDLSQQPQVAWYPDPA